MNLGRGQPMTTGRFPSTLTPRRPRARPTVACSANCFPYLQTTNYPSINARPSPSERAASRRSATLRVGTGRRSRQQALQPLEYGGRRRVLTAHRMHWCFWLRQIRHLWQDPPSTQADTKLDLPGAKDDLTREKKENCPPPCPDNGALVRKLIVTTSEAKLYSEVGGKSDNVEPFAIYFTCPSDDGKVEKDGHFRVGVAPKKALGWIKKEHVLPWNTRFLLVRVWRPTGVPVVRQEERERTRTPKTNRTWNRWPQRQKLPCRPGAQMFAPILSKPRNGKNAVYQVAVLTGEVRRTAVWLGCGTQRKGKQVADVRVLVTRAEIRRLPARWTSFASNSKVSSIRTTARISEACWLCCKLR